MRVPLSGPVQRGKLCRHVKGCPPLEDLQQMGWTCTVQMLWSHSESPRSHRVALFAQDEHCLDVGTRGRLFTFFEPFLLNVCAGECKIKFNRSWRLFHLSVVLNLQS